MRMMAVMAHQRAAVALRMEKLARRETIIDEQQCTAVEASRKIGHQRRRGEVDLGFVIVGQ